MTLEGDVADVDVFVGDREGGGLAELTMTATFWGPRPAGDGGEDACEDDCKQGYGRSMHREVISFMLDMLMSATSTSRRMERRHV